MRTFRTLLIAFFLVAGAGWASASESATARAYVEARMDSAMTLLNRDVSGDATAASARRDELQTLVRDTLDFQLLAQRTLGPHWETRSEEDRATFTALLQRLVEASYLRELRDSAVDTGNWRSTITDERVRRGRATVEGTVQRRGESHIVEVRLQERDGSWVVFDLVTDDVSLEESYGESFDNIIRQHGWDTLLQRMRDRIAEMEG